MTLPPRHVGIVGNREKKEARAALPALVRWIRTRGHGATVESAFARGARGVGRGLPLRTLVGNVDALLVLGGDGTFLAAAREAARARVPIIGVNLGGLGFLTETAQGDLYPALTRLFAGEVEVEERMMLEARVRPRGSGSAWSETGLNDAVIHQADEVRILRLEIRIGAARIGTLAADGLIIATPTGSTAYSLSAGGPIVRPTIDALVTTPICPHALAYRPLLVGADETVRVRVPKGTSGARLTVDGQVSRALASGDEVLVRRARSRLSMLTLKRESFYEVLRKKLAWAELPSGSRPRG